MTRDEGLACHGGSRGATQAEEAAAADKVGIWQGEFEPPWEVRSRRRTD